MKLVPVCLLVIYHGERSFRILHDLDGYTSAAGNTRTVIILLRSILWRLLTGMSFLSGSNSKHNTGHEITIVLEGIGMSHRVGS